MSPMASWGRGREENRPNAMVGAARRVHITDRNDVTSLRARTITHDQDLAWTYWGAIGEIKQSYLYTARLGSRVRLFAGYQSDLGDAPVSIGSIGGISRSLVVAAREELAKLSAGPGGQPQLIHSALLNFLVPGECYLVGTNGSWSIRSSSEIFFEDNEDPNRRVRLVTSMQRASQSYHYLPGNAYVARMWRMHPRYSEDPDSALLGILKDCEDFWLISQVLRASGRSRLNAGLLYVADELRFTRAAGPVDIDAPEPDVDPFEEELSSALSDPIGATDSPSEVLPLIVRGPREFKDGIVPINLARDISENDLKWHDTLLTRILSSLDVPTDLITGLKEVRYSNAKTISEDFLKSYIEPLIVLLCEGLTSAFLRPRLIARGFDPELVKNVNVWYDPSEIVTRPDRSQDANEGHDRGLLADSTWRKAHGFSELDKPTAREQIEKIVFTPGMVPPQFIIDYLRMLNPMTIEQIQIMAKEAADNPNLQPLDVPSVGRGVIGPDGQPVVPPTTKGGTPGPTPAVPGQPQTADNPAPTEPQGGHLPGGVVGRPPASQAPSAALWTESERVDLINMLTAAAAIPAGPSTEVRERNRSLEQTLELERRLRDALSVQLNDLVQRALERAGARTVSKVRNDPEHKAMVASVPIEQAFFALTADGQRRFSLDPNELVSDTINKGRSAFARLVTQAQDQGWRTLGGDVADRMKEHQAANLDRAWSWLHGKLIQLAAARLRNPGGNDVVVPINVVRDAATLAGGGVHDDAGVGVGASRPEDSGRAILTLAAMDATGWTFSDRKRWVYGVSEHHFGPHRELDGAEFDTWSDRALFAVDSESWPYTTHYYPGDHDGCRCDWLPVVAEMPVLASGSPE
jgi:hypothetical protein